MQHEDVLETLGFSKNDAKVYLTLLQLGPSPVTKISGRSKVNRTNVYDCLHRLTELGVVAFHKEGETKIFEAADPELLTNIVREKELALNSILPELRLKREFAPKSSEAHIYQGIVAVRNILNHYLEKGEPRYAYGLPHSAHRMVGKFFIEKYHRRRIELGLGFYPIYNSDAKDRIRFLNSLEHSESRWLSKEYDSPVSTSICGDEVVLTLYSENPLTIQIRNGEIAKAYKRYWDLLWKLANVE